MCTAVICLYTVRSKSFRTDYFKNRRHVRKSHTFFLSKRSPFDIYTCFCAGVQFLKSCRKFLFMDLLEFISYGFFWSQQHPQNEVLLTSFSTWGTENSLGEINLESNGWGGLIRGCNFFWVKNWQTLAALWVGAVSCNKKISREQNAAGRTRWMHFRRRSITPL